MTWVAALAGALAGCTPSGSPSITAPTTDAPRAPEAPSAAASASAAPATQAPAPPAETTAAPPTTAAATGKYPVRWTASVKLKSVADIAAALDEDVLSKGESLDLVHDADRRTVRTCVDYGKATADGFAPENTPGIAAESFFKARCTPLSFLRDARPSEASWVSGLRLDRDALRTLPASMNISLEGPSDQEKEAIAGGQRLAAFDPRLVVTKASATSVTFDDPKVFTSTVQIVAWGDFDHDGVEDVLLFQSLHSLDGSFRAFHHWVATRKGPKEPLMTVRDLGR
jgi:hypothetical protein